MCKSLLIKIAFTALFSLVGWTSLAQKKALQITQEWADTAVQVDGDVSEWDLKHYHAAAGLHFNLRNDESHIYFALKSANAEVMNKIMMGGISFSANLESDKKNPPKILFPILDRTPGKPGAQTKINSREEQQQYLLSRIRDVRVFGFREIPDGAISLQNNYGIKAAAGFDAEGNYTQEIAIPIKLLNIENPSDPLTYQVRLNGITQRNNNARPSVSSGMYGRPVYTPSLPKALAATEFYIKSQLATKNQL